MTNVKNEKIKKLNLLSDEQVEMIFKKLEFHRSARGSICSNLKKIEKVLKSTHEMVDVKTEQNESLERKNEIKTIRDKLKQIEQIRENVKIKKFRIIEISNQVVET